MASTEEDAAAADPETEIENDDDLCPICRQLLHRPVVTECSHTLCELCMTEWADVSVTSQMTIVPLAERPEDFVAANLQAKCPMCRTMTSAKRSLEVEERVKSRYPDVYRKRDEEAIAEEEAKEISIETLTVYIGNTVVPPENLEDERALFNWEFFVNISDTSVVNEVEILLHETFKKPRLMRYKPPYSVRRLGWGTFIVRANVVLKYGYSWISSDAEDTKYAKRASLPLEWELCFDEGGSQARCQLKIKKEGRLVRRGVNTRSSG
ncbi:hypothetical protein TWF173_005747 [Orbilia oligospora]|uniref:Uncharacterized protein n=1 Tax=Orbilia oligospora TaxID=2813651 RepID=A0A7C8VDJ9_ORBOL|nr:hypothetical protein TWF970_004677 [Orbilia oligospora]KAF3313676.1 hypothetical protein TWF173_005747 [Orbilia oligospora]